MRNENINEKERCRQLMMAVLDGELSRIESDELQSLFKKYPDLKNEYLSFKQLKEVTNTMAFKNPDKEIWETYWYNIYNRIERGLAWFVLTLGASILIAYGLGEMFADVWKDANLSTILKIGIFAALAGLILLLISVLREKLFLRHHERYKEVKR
ncbi:MAG TPA: hypothetical protein ENH29_04945 [Bacteroidetes bacterium]|nr:hypothetical protein [Bacteroidota bacterium]